MFPDVPTAHWTAALPSGTGGGEDGLRSPDFCGAVIGACALAAASSADILYDNFGPGDTYTTNVGWTISDGDPIGTDNDQGDPITLNALGADFFLDSVTAPIQYVTGVNRIDLTVYDDNGGEPGTPLETASLGDLPGFGSGDPPTTWVFSGTTVLQSGETYWFIASSDKNGSWLAWALNSTGDVGPHAFRADGGPWQISDNTRGAFRVEGTVVPAPAALALLGVAGLAARRRRR